LIFLHYINSGKTKLDNMFRR